jgi:hypothetical protein
MQTRSFLALSMCLPFLFGGGEGGAKQTEDLRHAAVEAARKAVAPVEVSLRLEDRRGTTRPVLRVTALADLPEVIARYALPGAARGRTEAMALGALARGTVRDVELPIDPSRATALAAGVDVVMSRGVTLHRGATLQLSEDARPKGAFRVIRGRAGEPPLRLHL